MGALSALLAPILSDLLKTLLSALLGAREAAATRSDLDQAHERAAVAEAATETQQAITEAADAQSNLSDDPDDGDALARSLRERLSTAADSAH